MADDMVRLDWNVNLTAEVSKAEWERALKEAEDDEDRNPQDTAIEHLAWQLSGAIEGEELRLSLTEIQLGATWIASADPPTVI